MPQDPRTPEPSGGRLSRPGAVAALVPAFKPDARLVGLVRDLRSAGFADIVVVDDGSPAEYAAVFEQAREGAAAVLLRHEANRGKGRALKTGLAHVGEHCPRVEGVVTVDADGQHRAPDVVRVAESFLEAPDALVIGARRLGRGTPLRSLLGNVLTRWIFRWTAGERVTDTQSGLRCFPRSAIPALLDLAGERYEYEMNVLAACPVIGLPLREVGIEAVYLEGNRSSHFHPLLDSMKIYFLLLRFTLSSLLAAGVDLLVFAAVWRSSRSILAAMVLARLVSGSMNFLVNRGPVFRSGVRGPGAPLRYAALVLALGTLSYGLIRGLAGTGVPVLPAKVAVETTLFLASFAVQRSYIFAARAAPRPGPG